MTQVGGLRRAGRVLVVLMAALFGAALAEAAGEQPVFTSDGIAIRGYDPVAYFTEGRPVQGRAVYQAKWNGALWRFASADNRRRFLEDPVAYAPQYGGFCAWAVAARGELYSTRPDAWRIVDGKLYLNFDQGIQRRWEKDIAGFIREADRRWPRIAGQD